MEIKMLITFTTLHDNKNHTYNIKHPHKYINPKNKYDIHPIDKQLAAKYPEITELTYTIKLHK